MAYLVAIVLGLTFGAADQFLGSRSITLGLWASTAAQVSAPWLVLPFLVGLTQQRSRRAATLGLAVSVAALVGYFAMTYSPLEIHPWSLHRFASGMVALTRGWYNPMYVLGGLITGPLFGLLGQRWRARRWWVSAVLVAGVLFLEPLVRWAAGRLMPPAPVWTVEVALGIIVGAIFVVAGLASRRVTPT